MNSFLVFDLEKILPKRNSTFTKPSKEGLDYLLKTLSYDPITGIFKRLIKVNKNTNLNKEPGSIRKDGYRQIYSSGKILLAHRIAWFIYYNQWPLGEIDHINGNRSDNKINNLRHCKTDENHRNTKIGKNNTSGCKGVNYCDKNKAWKVRISFKGTRYSYGYYKNYDDAVKVRKQLEKDFGYHPNHGRV